MIPPHDPHADITVAQLLSESRAAHIRFRTIHDATKNNDEAGMRAAIAEAHERRCEAHTRDPQHGDPAWALDEATPWHPRANRGVSHADLMRFYSSYLA